MLSSRIGLRRMRNSTISYTMEGKKIIKEQKKKNPLGLTSKKISELEKQILHHCEEKFQLKEHAEYKYEHLKTVGWFQKFLYKILKKENKGKGPKSFPEFVNEITDKGIKNIIVGAWQESSYGYPYVYPYVESEDGNIKYTGKADVGGDLPPSASGLEEFSEYVTNPNSVGYKGYIPTLTRWSIYLKNLGFRVKFEDKRDATLDVFIKWYPIFW